MRRFYQSVLNLVGAKKEDQEAAASPIMFVSPAFQQSHPGHPKAIVAFNGTTGVITPLFAYNVTFVTPNAAGDYTVQFITPFSTSGYAVVVAAEGTGGQIPALLYVVCGTMLTSSVRINTRNGAGTLLSFDHTSVVFFGDQ